MTRRRVGLAMCVAAVAMLGASVQAADIDGAWNLVFQTQAGPREASLTVVTEGDDAKARLDQTDLVGTYKDGTLVLEGNHYAAEAGYSDGLRIECRLVEAELRGESAWGQYVSTFVGTRREK